MTKARTYGGENKKAGKTNPRKKVAAESSAHPSLRDEPTEDLAMQEQETNIVATPPPDGKITVSPNTLATLAYKVDK